MMGYPIFIALSNSLFVWISTKQSKLQLFAISINSIIWLSDKIETIKSIADLLSATGHKSLNSLQRSDIFRRINYSEIKRFNETYPDIPKGAFLENNIPQNLKIDFDNSFIDKF